MSNYRASRVYFRHPETGCTAIVQKTYKLVDSEWRMQVRTVCDGQTIYKSQWHKNNTTAARRAYKRSTRDLSEFEVLSYE